MDRRLKKVIQQGRRRERTGGVASGLRCGFFRPANAAGGLFQPSASSLAARSISSLTASLGDLPSKSTEQTA
jgi:hypothetical protein